MEKTLNENNKNNESLSLINRKSLRLEGITEVISTSDTSLTIKLKDTNLTICGQELNIIKLDINSGILEVVGTVSLIKYGKAEKFFKRIFK